MEDNILLHDGLCKINEPSTEATKELELKHFTRTELLNMAVI
jgi:hypothetical protein